VKYVVFVILTLTSALSPLLTAVHLWQLKEWRRDRLQEHLRSEGAARQLFGRIRPALLVVFLLGLFVFPSERRWTLFFLVLFTAVTMFQVAKRERQMMPVWTAKARVLFGATLVATYVLAMLLVAYNYPLLLPGLVFLAIGQPLLFAMIWFLFIPLDRVLKGRIFVRAAAAREALPKDAVVIGVTGSVGKTTTKELLAHILRDRHPHVTPAHVNSEMGVAQWFLREAAGLRGSDKKPIFIIEMGAYRRGEIALLCRMMQPTIGVITFIGSQHLALFGSQQALCEAKGELLEALPELGHAFLNGDSPYCKELTEKCKCPVTVVGTGGREDLEAYDIEETVRGIRFRAGDANFDIPLHGTHNVMNVLLAVAAARHLGVPLSNAAEKLRTFSPLSRTFEVRTEHGVTILDDTHNASAASFKAAIAWARTQPFDKKILVTSGLIELGEEQAQTHADLGAFAANVFDEVYFLHRKSAEEFERGFARHVKLLPEEQTVAPARSLLVCIGLVPPRAINALLP
jgi:UDP-N-acetylmuramoyl-tripeptide--D-alanyl-D-alanine ligase